MKHLHMLQSVSYNPIGMTDRTVAELYWQQYQYNELRVMMINLLRYN